MYSHLVSSILLTQQTWSVSDLLRRYTYWRSTYKGFAWRIVRCSGLVDWNYLALLLQSRILTINYRSSQLMTVLRLAPFLPGIRVSSIVSDLVLIYETVTSSVSVVRWLSLHSWTLNHDYILTDFSSTNGYRPTPRLRLTYFHINYVTA
jgi:hypothetical protein